MEQAGGGAVGGGGRMGLEPTLRLLMEKGPLEGQALEFQPGTQIRIGRIMRGNTVAIKDAGISTKHLAISFGVQPPGRAGSGWTISDIGSSNGTFLNSDSLEPFVPVPLSDGDVIKFGENTSINVKFAVVREEESKRGKGRPRKGGKLGLATVNEGSVVEEKQEESSKRVTRSMRQEENVKENVGMKRTTRGTRKGGDVDGLVQDVVMGNKITRKGARGKRNAILSVKNEEVEKEVEEVEEKIVVEIEEISEVKQDSPVEKMMERENGGAVDMLVGKEALIPEKIDNSAKSANSSGIKRDSFPELDLEKITLGEWFDYLDVYLPKQIIDATDEIILGMRQKAKRFHEFMLQEKKAKEQTAGSLVG